LPLEVSWYLLLQYRIENYYRSSDARTRTRAELYAIANKQDATVRPYRTLSVTLTLVRMTKKKLM
jgi:hypothetical protein